MLNPLRKAYYQLTRREKEVADDIKTVFTSQSGQRVLHYLYRRFYMAQIYKKDEKNDLQDMAFRDGQRQVVMHIMDYLGMSEEDIQVIEKEAYRL